MMIITIFPMASRADSGDLYLESLTFQAQINTDGSMNVTEIWNIKISDTNTLFKTFKTDSTKYSGITNVKVTDITDGIEMPFEQIDTYMYHVTKGCYYGLKNSDGNFEIAWGIGLNSQTATKKYKIEYTVKDAIAKYNDYAELYWQFVGNDFEISADTVQGKITLPRDAEMKDDIKVWGHTKDLNGEIYATDSHTVEFTLNRFRSGRYIEIRTLFPTEQITSTARRYNSNILDNAINEETVWANKANQQRKMAKATRYLMMGGASIVAVLLWFMFIGKIKKYRDFYKTLTKLEPTQKLEYFRELPDESATPGEASFLFKKLYAETAFNPEFGKIFSATLLDLSLKGYIELDLDKNLKGKKAIKIRIPYKETEGLPEDEEAILAFLKKARQDEESEMTIKQLEKYIKGHPTGIETLIEKTFNRVKQSVKQKQYFDAKQYKVYEDYTGKFALYLMASIFSIMILPISIVFIINTVYCYKIMKRINVLTQAGLDQQEMWKGLKKYMEDFSLLKEREVPELVLWEKYLVFATAFGIAGKVLKQLKMVYPNIDQTDMMNTSAYMYFMYHSDFDTSFSSAISSSIASATMSSGSGAGGGFSGGGGFGGGGRRRRRTLMKNILK